MPEGPCVFCERPDADLVVVPVSGVPHEICDICAEMLIHLSGALIHSREHAEEIATAGAVEDYLRAHEL